MASTYSKPDEYWAWWIDGDSLALVTTKNTSSKNLYEASDEDISDGCLIRYAGEPDPIEDITDTPNVDNKYHIALVNYVKWKLAEDIPGQDAYFQSEKYKKLFNDQVRSARRDKIGGVRQLAPYSLR